MPAKQSGIQVAGLSLGDRLRTSGCRPEVQLPGWVCWRTVCSLDSVQMQRGTKPRRIIEEDHPDWIATEAAVPLNERHLEAVIAATLAVNKYGLEKSYKLLPSLRKAGLTDPVMVAKADVGDVMMRLCKAGYDRGMLTEMMAGRLVHLMKAVHSGALDGLNTLVDNRAKEGTLELLCTVKGIGPKVAADAWMILTT